MECPYCHNKAICVDGAHVYPLRPNLHEKHFYVCDPCDARVGCHPGSKEPLGVIANAEHRRWKLEAHRAFDPIWKRKYKTRKKAYIWLAKELDIDIANCHIGMFSLELCKRTTEISNNFLITKRI